MLENPLDQHSALHQTLHDGLVQLCEAHRFNVALMPAHEVHALAFGLLEQLKQRTGVGPASVSVEHDLYKTGDAGAPLAIQDRNGEVVLQLCKRCRKGESELVEPCIAGALGKRSLSKEELA